VRHRLICVGIPSGDAGVHAALVDSLLAEQLMAAEQGIHFHIQWELGCSNIDVARNRIASAFLRDSPSGRLVFVDSDISWKAGDLVRLASRVDDVVGATYKPKDGTEKWHGLEPFAHRGRDYTVGGLPTGFLAISRQALERLRGGSRVWQSVDGKPLWEFFRTGFHGDRYLTEDYGFCATWRATGGECILDPSIVLRHWAGVRAYGGDPTAWLAEQSAKEVA
jgi:hypothetical protein